MDAREVEERMATERLRAALVEHIMAAEEMPSEVSERVREMYRDRFPETTADDH